MNPYRAFFQECRKGKSVSFIQNVSNLYYLVKDQQRQTKMYNTENNINTFSCSSKIFIFLHLFFRAELLFFMRCFVCLCPFKPYFSKLTLLFLFFIAETAWCFSPLSWKEGLWEISHLLFELVYPGDVNLCSIKNCPRPRIVSNITYFHGYTIMHITMIC